MLYYLIICEFSCTTRTSSTFKDDKRAWIESKSKDCTERTAT
ncbi:hypothetical protein HanPI659440_Chr10g0391951 [Helianthus annuus]|nr:hypothetical protein HanPI659440_Chr10g0391951 [Helianthus annuus]